MVWSMLDYILKSMTKVADNQFGMALIVRRLQLYALEIS